MRDRAIILALAAVALVPSLLTRDVWAPDEPRYVEVAREMVASGDYIVPRLNGEIYPDKPPLFFWLTAGLWHLGFGAESGRVVAALSAAGVLLLTYGLGRRLYGPAAGLWAAVVTLTALLFLGIAKVGLLDPLLCLCMLVAISRGVRALDGGEGRGKTWLAAYAACALGILTKGPVAIAVPGLVLLGYGLARRREVKAGGWWHLAGAGLCLAIVGGWLVPAVICGGKAYSTHIVFQQTLQRLKPYGTHREPIHHFLTRAPVFLFPWSLLAVLATVAGIRAARGGERQTWLPILWLAVVLVFFSIPSGKRERYVLPMVPAAGLLCGWYIEQIARRTVRCTRRHGALWAATLGLASLAPIALAGALLYRGRLVARLGEDPATSEAVLAALGPARQVIAAAAALFMLGLCLRALLLPWTPDGERRRAAALVAFVLALSLAVDLVAAPAINLSRSARRVVRDANAYLDLADEVHLLRADFGGMFALFRNQAPIPLIDLTLEEDQRLAGLPPVERIAGEREIVGARLAAALASQRRVAVVAWRGDVLDFVDAQQLPGLQGPEDRKRDWVREALLRQEKPRDGAPLGTQESPLATPRRVIPITWAESLERVVGLGRSFVLRPTLTGHPTLVVVLNWNPEGADTR